MVFKLCTVVKEFLFPSSHLQRFLRTCSQIEFESKLSPRPQMHARMFYPFYYKNLFVQDCIIELKERDSKEVARRFGEILARWIARTVNHVVEAGGQRPPAFYLIPLPQHISKTKEKGFCHTTSLTYTILKILISKYKISNIYFSPCITKQKNIKKLHSGFNKKKRFALIKNSMKADLSNIHLSSAYFFIIDDVFTSGATFKEARRSLTDCGAPSEHIFFISIAH